jgi:two-component system chemotaxis response regulator CheB
MNGGRFEAVVIGASAGALEALSAILPRLPEDYALPVMVVVHVPSDRKSLISELMQVKCQVRVIEATDKEPISPGTVYFAPPDYHLLVELNKRLSLSNEEPVFHSRPSIDVLFETAADAYGAGLIGLILTGANNDGANGLKTVMEAGGAGIVQKPELAYASAMPLAALELNADAKALTLPQIVTYLLEGAPR